MIKLLKYKRILAVILLIITILSITQPIFAVSGSGTATWVGGQYYSGIRTTDHSANSNGMLIRRLVNSETGEQITVFCSEHGVDFKPGVRVSGSYYIPTDSNMIRACKIAYLGWYKNYGDYVVNINTSYEDKKQYVLTQQYIWEVLGQSSATFRDDDIQAEYENFKRDIDNQIAQIQRKPSFNGSTIDILAGESKNLEDSNGVLSSYNSIDNTTNGIRITHSYGSNSISISVDENTNLENYTITEAEFKSWGMIKNGTEDNNTMIYFEFSDGVQDQLYSMSYNEPISLDFSVKIETFGKLELQKLNTNGDLVDGAVFNVTGANGYNQDVTVANGKITIEKLRQGTYTIKEKTAPYGYLLNNQSYDVEVKVNQTTTQAIVNNEPTGTIQVIKKSEQGDLIKDTIFKVTADEDIKNVAGTKTYYTRGQVVANIKTDSKGLAEITNLPLGKYIVEETKASTGYLLDSTKHNVTLSYKGQTEKIVLESFEKVDTTPTGEIKVYKTDNYSNKLQGAEISLYAREDIENVARTKTWNKKGDLVAKAITNEQGMVIFSDLHLGHYYVKETNAPEGYLLNTKEFDAELKYKDQSTKVIYLDVSGVIDEQPTGTIKIDKTIAIREDVDTSLIDTSDLSGIEFKLSAKEDIIDKADGSKIYKKGQEIKKYNLTKDGKLTITDLPMGVYEIVETKTLDGLVLNTTKYEIKFEQKDLSKKVYTEKLDISNDTTLVEFSKTDVTGDKELKGAKLSVLDSENNVIDEWTSTDKTHKIEGLTIGKEYSLKEEIAPDGYVKATSVKFIIKDTNKIQKVNMIDKIVEISKTDITNGNELEGAELEVTDEDGNVIDKWTSTKEPHQVKGLEEGKTYILKETTAPYGFEITEEIQFVVTTEKDTQRIEMKDMPILKNVKVIKVDAETKETIKDKIIFGIYEDPECTKLIKEVKSNKEDGTALFEKLRYGTYYIKEIKAPKDYELSGRVAKVEINDKGIFVDDEQVEETDSTIEFTFENKKIEVPKTGDESRIKLLAGAILVSLLGIIYIVIHNHNKNKEN